MNNKSATRTLWLKCFSSTRCSFQTTYFTEIKLKGGCINTGLAIKGPTVLFRIISLSMGTVNHAICMRLIGQMKMPDCKLQTGCLFMACGKDFSCSIQTTVRQNNFSSVNCDNK